MTNLIQLTRGIETHPPDRNQVLNEEITPKGSGVRLSGDIGIVQRHLTSRKKVKDVQGFLSFVTKCVILLTWHQKEQNHTARVFCFTVSLLKTQQGRLPYGNYDRFCTGYFS